MWSNSLPNCESNLAIIDTVCFCSCLSAREPHLNLSVWQWFPDDEPVPEVGPRVDPRRLEDLDAAAGATRLEVADGEHQAPSGWKAS